MTEILGNSVGRILVRRANSKTPDLHLIVKVNRKNYTFLNLMSLPAKTRTQILNMMVVTKDFRLTGAAIADQSCLTVAPNRQVKYDMIVDRSNYRSIKWQ